MHMDEWLGHSGMDALAHSHTPFPPYCHIYQHLLCANPCHTRYECFKDESEWSLPWAQFALFWPRMVRQTQDGQAEN